MKQVTARQVRAITSGLRAGRLPQVTQQAVAELPGKPVVRGHCAGLGRPLLLPLCPRQAARALTQHCHSPVEQTWTWPSLRYTIFTWKMRRCVPVSVS